MAAEKIILPANEIKRMHRDKCTVAEMARKFHVSESTMHRRIEELGLPKHNPVYDKGMYIRMMELGMSDEDIAYVFCTSVRNLYRFKHRAGLTRKYNKRKKESNDEKRSC